MSTATAHTRVLRTALTLGQFTVSELSVYSSVPAATVRSVLRRHDDAHPGLFEQTPGAVRRDTGRPRTLWTITDPERLRSTLADANQEAIDSSTHEAVASAVQDIIEELHDVLPQTDWLTRALDAVSRVLLRTHDVDGSHFRRRIRDELTETLANSLDPTTSYAVRSDATDRSIPPPPPPGDRWFRVESDMEKLNWLGTRSISSVVSQTSVVLTPATAEEPHVLTYDWAELVLSRRPAKLERRIPPTEYASDTDPSEDATL